jgi:hypothetical protein
MLGLLHGHICEVLLELGAIRRCPPSTIFLLLLFFQLSLFILFARIQRSDHLTIELTPNHFLLETFVRVEATSERRRCPLARLPWEGGQARLVLVLSCLSYFSFFHPAFACSKSTLEAFGNG